MTTVTNRPFNFGAGPAALPTELLLEIQSELLDWQGLGMSVMEVGHRTEAFMQLLQDAEDLLRRLLNIPNSYHVLFLGGAARLQFGMIAENFITEQQQAGYLVSGLWSSMAFQEAARIKKAYCIASGENTGFTAVPPVDNWVYQENTAYCYFAPNETVNGLRCSTLPTEQNIPVVADMTSCLLSESLNINDYAFIFAGAQKNIANAGLTMVIVADSFIQSIRNDALLTMLDYRT
ncbi:MAG: 3-phosphoserine/phosphohydroxythreonine transaminase, partial [Gammaproteobacteria bacterium]|nr:3-phosphoserine/phosphohydroxythreonine transaminase [Gammaproteobacteria bacterium]